MKTVSVPDLQLDIPKYLALAADEELVIMMDGQPAGLLRGFTEDDLFDYELETHPLFLQRVSHARAEFQAGRGIRIEEVRSEILAELEPA
ncbi:MAG: hypothetical protein K1X65_09125 [Caldilineales bacterium]|nr:hypothetical protein [Caldilineales bacterium]